MKGAVTVSISIYYTARRDRKLSNQEQEEIDRLISRYSDEFNQMTSQNRSEAGYNGEAFCVYDSEDPTEPDVIFEGATKLPDGFQEALWEAVQHWTTLLSQIRRVIPDAKWHVHVHDHDLIWDEQLLEYDLTR